MVSIYLTLWIHFNWLLTQYIADGFSDHLYLNSSWKRQYVIKSIIITIDISIEKGRIFWLKETFQMQIRVVFTCRAVVLTCALQLCQSGA